MRIIAGTLKGRRLAGPTWSGIRPTSDKLRETLFNILAPRIPAAQVLDGFAGTGAVGIEALSRGARHVTFVERDRRAVALIEANLQHCGVAAGYAIIRADLCAAVRDNRLGRAFDVIFLDPPYDPAGVEAVLAAVGGCLATSGVVVLEHARRQEAPAAVGTLARARVVASGDSALTFYRRATATAAATHAHAHGP